MNIHKTDIEWCSHTWNPVTGCKHGCEYCYARRMVSRFGPHPCERPIIEPLEVLPKGTGCYYVEQPILPPRLPKDIAKRGERFMHPYAPKRGTRYRRKSVRRTRSHRMKFCVQKGVWGQCPQQADGRKCECV